jgi:hypothetical protein
MLGPVVHALHEVDVRVGFSGVHRGDLATPRLGGSVGDAAAVTAWSLLSNRSNRAVPINVAGRDGVDDGRRGTRAAFVPVSGFSPVGDSFGSPVHNSGWNIRGWSDSDCEWNIWRHVSASMDERDRAPTV